MDLPPPPPAFSRHHIHHLRYENVLRPPDFLPPPYPPHLPPPQTPSLNTPLPPPPPSPPPLQIHHMSPTLHPPRFAFSPRRYPIIERSHRYEFDPLPKPYIQPTLPPPPPPPPPRDDVSLRVVRDYPERNLVFEHENYSRGRIDDIRELPGNWDRDLGWGAPRAHSRVPETDRGIIDRYRDVIPESFELCRKRDDGRIWDSGLRDWGSELDWREYDERRWDSGMNDRNRDLYRERDYDERRWNDTVMNDRSRDLYRERDYDERRWKDTGMNDRSRDLYRERDYDERGWKDTGMNDRSRDLYRERDYDERRWKDTGLNDRSSDLYRERDYNERRWDTGTNDWSRDLYRERDYNERRWDTGTNDWSRDLYREHSFDERRWDSGMNNLGDKVHIQMDDDEMRREHSRSAGVLSRLGNMQPELPQNDLRFGRVLSRLGNRQPEYSEADQSLGGVLSRLGNRKPEFADDNSSLGRFSGRLGAGVCNVNNGELIWPDKKKRLQKKNTLFRTQQGKIRSRHIGGFKSQHLANDSSRGSFKVKEKGSVKMQTRMEVNREREQSPMELSISFKSNALVAKAIQVSPHPSTELSIRSNSVKERTGCDVSALPAAKQDIVSDFQFDPHEASQEHVDIGATKHPLLGADPQMERESHAIEVDACQPLVPKLKRKRSNLNARHGLERKRNSLNTRPASSYVVRDVMTTCSGRSGGLVTTTEDAYHVHQLRVDGVAHPAHENFSSQEKADRGDSLDVNQDMNISNKHVHDTTFVCDADRGAIKPASQYTKFGRDIEDEVSEHRNMGEAMQIKGYAIISDVGFKDANSKDFLQNRDDTPQVMLDAKHFRSLEGAAVTDSPNVAFDISVSSCVLSANNKETSPEFEASFSDNMGTVLPHNVYSIEGSPEMISGRETCVSIDNSSSKVISDSETCVPVANLSKVTRKREHRGDQMGVSSTKTNVNVETVRFTDVGITSCLLKDIVPAMDGDFVGEKERCKEVNCLQECPSGVQNSDLEVHVTANGSSQGSQKKQKLSSPRSSISSLSEDDTIADGFSSPPILEQHPTRPSELGAEQSGNTSSAPTTISQCRTTDARGEDLNVANQDEILVDRDRLLGIDDLALITSGISCSYRNGPSASDSGDDSLASSFDMRSCMSSPEGLQVYSDSCISRNTETSSCLSDTEMICRSDKISNKKNVFADPNTNSLGKCLEVAVNKSETNPVAPQSLLKNTSQVVKKRYPVHGKLTWSKDQVPSAVTKVFPVQHPSNFSNTKKLYPPHATKSRTWCRTVDSSASVAKPKVKPPVPQSNATKAAGSIQSSYIRKGNSLLRKNSPSNDTSHGFPGSSCSVYRPSPCTNTIKSDLESEYKTGDADSLTLKRTGKVNTSEITKAMTQNRNRNSLSCSTCNLEEPLPISNPHSNDFPSKTLDVMEERIKYSPAPECGTDSVVGSDSPSTAVEGNAGKKAIYVKRRSYQLVATSNSDDKSILGLDSTQARLSDGYYKSRENQLLRASPENHVKKGNEDATASGLVPHSIIPKIPTRRQSSLGKTSRSSKFSFVWKLHDTQSSEKHKNSLRPQKVWPHMFSTKRAAYWKSLIQGINPSHSNISQKLLVSRKRGAIYTKSSHGYSLRMSKVLSVGSSSLKWSKSIERSSRKANEEATRAVTAAEKRKKEEKGAVHIASKSRNHVSRERIFRIGSDRYKMDPTRRTLQRITDKESSSSVAPQSKKNVKRSYIPKRLLIGNEDHADTITETDFEFEHILVVFLIPCYLFRYVRIGNGNQLIRDPKKRVRVLASEKVRWSLRTARLRLARKSKYCQFFTRFGKCNKDGGKCPYIHDPSKVVVCTKFLAGSCTNVDCKLTHKVIPERMQDCSYFLKGSCSNDSCPYRHVRVNPDSSVCENFLRGYCADGNECQKKHTYTCPAFEATGVCPQASTCKLHHPKKKTEKKPTMEQKVVRGRYFDGGLVGVDDWSSASASAAAPLVEKLATRGKDDMIMHEGQFPDFISLEVSDDDETDQGCDELQPDAQKDHSVD
ncbi:uncharacterized protein LOC121779795 isoform X2 [Salvia splendens]|uniref:uncharacterized protein LOC121779795 isoform X2 n=1 Tax=Salvia splendens TaxID=180675 RepID=UPI001C277F52|nr:uncharacterized protein LOC121779795 isoform X2 [Salvia splendens]